MKMTKIESARIIVEQEGSCVHVECKKCFTTREKCGCKKLITISWTERKLALAEAYIKRHEQKTKKKDHILDTTKKVTRPNFRKYLRDKIDMKVRVTPELSEELQKIAGEEGIKTRGGDLLPKNTGCRIIRFYCCDHYSLVYYPGVVTFEKIEATEYNPETDTLVEKVEEPKPIKTVGIDNSDVTLALTAQYEPTVKENLSVPQPIKLPDFVYSASKNGVGFIDTKSRTFNTNDKGELLINDKPCFATPEEALQVAKKLLNGDGK